MLIEFRTHFSEVYVTNEFGRNLFFRVNMTPNMQMRGYESLVDNATGKKKLTRMVRSKFAGSRDGFELLVRRLPNEPYYPTWNTAAFWSVSGSSLYESWKIGLRLRAFNGSGYSSYTPESLSWHLKLDLEHHRKKTCLHWSLPSDFEVPMAPYKPELAPTVWERLSV